MSKVVRDTFLYSLEDALSQLYLPWSCCTISADDEVVIEILITEALC